MKVAVFENEYDYVKAAFDAANVVYFNNKLQIINYPSSQDIKNFEEVLNYDFIFIDIDLSKKSILDGYGIAKQIIQLDEQAWNKIIIITGSTKVEEELKRRQLPIFKTLTKPFTFRDLSKIMS